MPEFRGRFGGGRGRGGGGGRGGDRFGDSNYTDNPEDERFRKLFIGGMSYDTTENTLKSHFEEWGEVVDIVVMKDPNTKRSRGFGFVTYKFSAQVDDAQGKRPHTIDGREVECKRAMPREGNESQELVNKLFCGGLSAEATEGDLQDYFQEFGNILKVDIIVDKETGKNKGFGFVEFDDYDPVDKCVLKKKHDVAGKVIDVSKALPKGDKDGGGGRRGGRGRGRGGGYGQSSGYGGSSYGSSGYGSSSYGASNYGSGSSWGSGGGGSSYGGNSGYSMGSGYGDSYGGGSMKSGYQQRGQGPYGGGYGSSSYSQGGSGGW